MQGPDPEVGAWQQQGQQSPHGPKPPPPELLGGPGSGGVGRAGVPGLAADTEHGLCPVAGLGPQNNGFGPELWMEEERGRVVLSQGRSLLCDLGFLADSSSTHKGMQMFLVTPDPMAISALSPYFCPNCPPACWTFCPSIHCVQITLFIQPCAWISPWR